MGILLGFCRWGFLGFLVEVFLLFFRWIQSVRRYLVEFEMVVGSKELSRLPCDNLKCVVYSVSWICVDEFMQARASRKTMWCSFSTSASLLVRDVASIPRTIPTAFVVLPRQPMESGSRGCGKRWQIRSLSSDPTQARGCVCPRILLPGLPTLELHAM